MKYLIYNTESEARERSLQEALSRGASPSTVTQYWWAWRETSDGKWALCVPDAEVEFLTENEQQSALNTVEFKADDPV